MATAIKKRETEQDSVSQGKGRGQHLLNVVPHHKNPSQPLKPPVSLRSCIGIENFLTPQISHKDTVITALIFLKNRVPDKSSRN